MGFWKEVGSEFKRKSKKARTITEGDREFIKKVKKAPQRVSKVGKNLDFTRLVGHGRSKKPDVKKIRVKKIKGKFKKGKKQYMIIEI